jgi:aerobic carbon-monoxide dehydrogenase medium subunit
VKPAPFEYVAPEHLDEAASLLSEHGDDAKVLAGGQSLVPLLAFRLATPGMLIDLNRIADLEFVREDGDRLVMGAMARHAMVERMADLSTRCPILAEGVALIGHPAIRNRGTVGGSLAHADPAAEWPALLLALDGEVDVTSARGRRTVPAEDLFATYFTTTLEPDEIVAEVRLTIPNGRTGSTFVELARRHGDFAIAGVGTVVGLSDDVVSDAKIVLIGVRDRPVRARKAEELLRNESPTDEAFSATAEAVIEDIDPVSDVHGSSDYRRHVAKVLVRRALRRAADRARAANGRRDG